MLVNLDDYERAAAERLEAGLLGYYAGGAGDERTLRANTAAWGERNLRPRVLVDVSSVDPATTVLGTRVAMPVLVAPTALHGMAHADAEPGMARAAAAAGTVFCLSTLATSRPSDVVTDGPRWFQVYCFRDKAVTEALLDEALAAGFEALVLTVDAPRAGRRERDHRTGFAVPETVDMPAVRAATGALTCPTPAEFFSLLDLTLDWSVVGELARHGRPVVLKGIQTAEDAPMNPSTTLAAALAIALAGFAAATALKQGDAPAAPALDPLLDLPGAVCTPTGGGRPRLLETLVLAQSETRPFPPQPMKAAEGRPPLYDNLGTLSLPAGTKNAKAQAYFDQGLRWAFAFNHAEAQRAFRAAQQEDPAFALAQDETWHAERATPMTPAERDAHNRRVVEVQRIREAEQIKAHAEAAERARQIWEAAQPAQPRKLSFKVNELIVYPAHGVGKVVQIEEQEIAGARLELYIIDFEKEKLRLKVPTNKSEQKGMRKLADKPLIEQAMKVLKGRARIKRTMWSRRAQEYEAKINSGDLVSIAEVTRDLFRADDQPEQSYSERQIFEAASSRLARELAAMEKTDEPAALKKILAILNEHAPKYYEAAPA